MSFEFLDPRNLDLMPPLEDPHIGRAIAGYTIVAPLGMGSMSTVYRARQDAIGREVALKLLRADLAAQESAKARFTCEARANGRLSSTNTVRLFDFGESSTHDLYMTMELLEGESLSARLASSPGGRLPWPVAIDVAVQALRSLAEAHAKGIIHCDLKPDNLFFARITTASSASESTSMIDGPAEILKVLDFGIAKMEGEPGGASIARSDSQRGVVFGTPRYMSPEQAQGFALDARSDLYSLGVILYEVLTGAPPFLGRDAVSVMTQHIRSMPAPPRRHEPSIPVSLERIVLQLLSKSPADRYPSATDLTAALLFVLEAEGQ